ncbi:MAG: SpoIIE family protein phosphatase [Anaerolineae bacterium]|nr:SpoIIE family protein phosphatase [Anaerolineae bacterium]
MDHFLQAMARRLRPDFDALSDVERTAYVGDLFGILYGAPLALGVLVWLAASTEVAVLRAQWPILVFLFSLLFIFDRLGFFMFIEVKPGVYANFGGSLDTLIVWSAALLFGPSALWLAVLLTLVGFLRDWRTANHDGRVNLLRRVVLSVAAECAALIGLTFYVRLGGTFPLSGLALAEAMPAFIATGVSFLINVVVLIPFIIYLSRAPALAEGSSDALFRFWLISIGWPILVQPFAVLAASFYTQSRLFGYLFFIAGVMLVSLLANQLSRAFERSQLRSRELEKLEQLSRAIVNAPPDVGALPEILKTHVANVMFPYTAIEIYVFPDQVLLCHPEDRPPVDLAVWEWLRESSEAHVFLPKDRLPWGSTLNDQAVALVPILDVESARLIGGIYLARHRDPESLPDLLPAAQSLAAQVASFLHSITVYEQSLEHQRVEQELYLAWQIQVSFLPERLPEIPGWQLAVKLQPARQTSGDFYDVIALPNGRFGILIADVADKGLGAALYMALSRTLLRTYAIQYHTRPDHVFKVANQRLLSDTDVSMFVTTFYGILDPASGMLTYCNAGHNPPIFLSTRNGGDVCLLQRTGIALGVMEDAAWDHATISLTAGDVLTLYTDGVTDAEDVSHQFFGVDRLVTTVQSNRGRPAQQMQAAVAAAVREFVGDAPQFDDITLMVLSRE